MQGSLSVSNSDALQAGMWQTITLQASNDLAVFVPYFIQDPGSMRAQNGTVLDMKSGDKVSMNILFPPRNEEIVFFLGDIGRVDWPIREPDQSWMTWLNIRAQVLLCRPSIIKIQGHVAMACSR